MYLVFSSNGWGTSAGYHAKIHVSFASDIVRPAPGQLGYCTSCFGCGADEGHCDSHDQCINGHFCALDSCPSSLGYSNGTNCCQDVSCGYVNMKNKELFSPNYPNKYKNSLQCSQQISVASGKIITLEFTSFSVSNLFSRLEFKN